MGETKMKEKNTFTLPNEVVTVKFIKRKKGMASNVDDNHVISGGMMTGSKKKFSAPLQRNGAIANILSTEEKEVLEELTGLNLSVYGDFWKEFQVSLYKDDASNVFDKSNPMDYLSIKLLESLVDDISPSWTERNEKQTYQFVITGEEEIQDEDKIKLDVKKEAWKVYGKMEDDKDKLIGVLNLLSNKLISRDSKLRWIQGEVEKYVDTKPAKFLSVVQDESLETKMLINEAIEKGYITKNNNKYSTVDGLDLAKNKEIPSFDNAIKYLEDPKNQDVRDLIIAKTNK